MSSQHITQPSDDADHTSAIEKETELIKKMGLPLEEAPVLAAHMVAVAGRKPIDDEWRQHAVSMWLQLRQPSMEVKTMMINTGVGEVQARHLVFS